MDIGVIAALVTAVATLGAIFLAFWQFIKTLKHDERNRTEDYERRLKNEAYHVDAWVVVGKNDTRSIIIRNDTTGAIRDVSLSVIWNNGASKLGVPGTKMPWRILPRGVWVVSKTDKTDVRYKWKFPKAILENELAVDWHPQFADAVKHEVLSITFTDPYDNVWERCYGVQGYGEKSLRKIRSTKSDPE